MTVSKLYVFGEECVHICITVCIICILKLQKHKLSSLKNTKRYIVESLSDVSTVTVTFFFITCENLHAISDDLDTSFLYVFPLSMLTEFTMGSQ